MFKLTQLFQNNQKLIGLISVTVVVIVGLWYIQSTKETLDVISDDVVDVVEVDNISPEPIERSVGAPVPEFSNDRDITPLDLLPVSEDANNFDGQFPSSVGDLSSKNFLTAGYNIGINTVSSSLRNANMQLRADPYIPVQSTGLQMNQSSMIPDLNRKTLDGIGC